MPETVPSQEEFAALLLNVGTLVERLTIVEEKLKLPNSGTFGDLKLQWECNPANFPDIAAFQANCLGHDFPWGRINGELQQYVPYNSDNLKVNNQRIRLVCTQDMAVPLGIYGCFRSTNLIFKRRVPMNKPWQLDFNCRMPAGVGFWPAGWLYPVELRATSDSEIDTFESLYNNRNGTRDHRRKMYQGVHGRVLATHFTKQDRWGAANLPFDTSDDFHTYSTRWKPSAVLADSGLVSMLIDGELTEIQELVWDGPDPNIIFNLACVTDLTKVDWPGSVIESRQDCILPVDFIEDRNCLDLRHIRLFT